MGRRVFVSYKYWDSDVQHLPNIPDTRVHHYVEKIRSKFKNEDFDFYYWHGEEKDTPLDHLSDPEIEEELKSSIFDTTVTIVFISPQMKSSEDQKSQWIPWEISYSLKNITRGEKTKRTNGLVAVILPDRDGLTDYALTRTCATFFHLRSTFPIIRGNFENLKQTARNSFTCKNCGEVHYNMDLHYFIPITWDEAQDSENLKNAIENAFDRSENEDKYVIVKDI